MSKESIREWYDRTTTRARWILTKSAVAVVSVSIGFYSFAPDWLHLKLQIFNGAITIPAFGALWLAAFIILWLLPMREVSFRGQESMERLVNEVTPIVQDAKVVMADVRAMVAEIREKRDVEKIAKILDKIAADGNFEKAVGALAEIPKKLDSLIQTAKRKGVDDMLEKL